MRREGWRWNFKNWWIYCGGVYEAAPEGEKVVRIVLFGIEYAEELGIFSPNRVARAADIPPLTILKSTEGAVWPSMWNRKKQGRRCNDFR